MSPTENLFKNIDDNNSDLTEEMLDTWAQEMISLPEDKYKGELYATAKKFSDHPSFNWHPTSAPTPASETHPVNLMDHGMKVRLIGSITRATPPHNPETDPPLIPTLSHHQPLYLTEKQVTAISVLSGYDLLEKRKRVPRVKKQDGPSLS